MITGNENGISVVNSHFVESEREKQRAREMMQRYKNVFGSGEGRLVLGDILTLWHFGDNLDPNDPVNVTEHNLGITILRMAGDLIRCI